MLTTNCEMVLVYWTDAAMSCSPHWNDGDRPEPPAGKVHNMCATIGWMTHSDDDWVQIVTTLTDGAHGHVTEIPHRMIHAVKVLSVGDNCGSGH